MQKRNNKKNATVSLPGDGGVFLFHTEGHGAADRGYGKENPHFLQRVDGGIGIPSPQVRGGGKLLDGKLSRLQLLRKKCRKILGCGKAPILKK